MVRWRFILFLAILVVAQVKCSKTEEDNEDENENADEDTTTTTEEDESDEEEVSSQPAREPSTTGARLTRTTSSTLQCYVCSYKRDSSVMNCLEPLRHNVTVANCRSPGDKCFTAVETRESGVSIAVRGCKSDCVSLPDITCCNTDRCNSQVIGRPAPLRTVSISAASKSLPQTILYFVTVLLLLQAVVRVNIV